MKENYNATHLFRRVAQLGSATGLGPVGRRFKSYLADHSIYFFNIPFTTRPSLSWIEQRPSKAWVKGSNPLGRAIKHHS